MAVGSDKKRNVSKAVEQIHKAKSKGAQLVALPECFNSPYGTSKPQFIYSQSDHKQTTKKDHPPSNIKKVVCKQNHDLKFFSIVF